MPGRSWPTSPSTRPSATPSSPSVVDLSLGNEEVSSIFGRSRETHGVAHGSQHVGSSHGGRRSTWQGTENAASLPAAREHHVSINADTLPRQQPAVGQGTKLSRKEGPGDTNRDTRDVLLDCNVSRRDDGSLRVPRPHAILENREVTLEAPEGMAAGSSSRTRTDAGARWQPPAAPNALAVRLKARILEHVGRSGLGPGSSSSGAEIKPAEESDGRLGTLSRLTTDPLSTVTPEVTHPGLVSPEPDSKVNPWWQEAYHIDWRPQRFVFKLRQEMESFRLGANCELRRSDEGLAKGEARSSVAPKSDVCGFNPSTATWKLVLKPSHAEGKWKVIYEPQRQDVRFITRKISLGKFINFQIGIGHDFRNNATGLKWRISPAFGTSIPPRSLAIRRKTTFPICPGVDVRAGWTAEYTLPDIHGSKGTGEPAVGLNVGRLSAAVDRVEAIFSHNW